MAPKTLKLMGRKRGMTQLFDAHGQCVACTVLEVPAHVVTQVKSDSTDGYNAIQLACEEVRVKDPRTIANRVNKPQVGLFHKVSEEAKVSIAPRRHLAETRVESVEGYQVGQMVGLETFENVSFIDTTAMSKGKGFQGVIRRHNFAGGPAAHGSGFHRHGGSTGMRSSPGRCLPGQKMPGHMGAEQVTVQSLKVMALDVEANLLVVAGAVPGPRDGLVYVTCAKKKKTKKQK